MAEPIDPNASQEMIEAIKQLNAQLERSSKYTEDMHKAISAMAKPAEQTSNLAKAIQQAFGDTSKSLEKISQGINKLEDSSKRTSASSKDIVDSMAQMVMTQETLSDAGLEYAASLDPIIQKGFEIKRVQQENAEFYSKQTAEARKHEEALSNQVGLFASLNKAAASMHDNLARNSNMYAKGSATFAEIGFGKTNMREAVKSIGSSISSIIPTAGGIGGIIGLMIAGRVEDAKFDAIGQTAALAFQKMGGSVAGFAGHLGSLTRQMTVDAAAAEGDLAAVAEAFASTGIKASEAAKHVKGFNTAYGSELIVVALAADKALQLPAGTMAKLSGQLSTDLGTSAEKAFRQLTAIAGAAKDAGLNMATFMAQTMEASSALRMLNANGAAAAAQLTLSSYKAMGGGQGDPGRNRYAQQYAASGAANAAQAIAGLDVGMSAVLGQRLGMGSGLDAWYAMKGGDNRDPNNKLDVTKIVAEMASLAKENAKSRSEQVYFLTKVAGVDKSGAEAILDFDPRKGKLNEASAREMFKTGYEKEAEKTSQITRDLRQIRDGLLHVGVGLLGMVVAGIKSIIDGLKWGFGALMSSRLINGDSDSREKWAANAKRYETDFMEDVKLATKAAYRVLGGARQAGNAVVNLLWDIIDPDRKPKQQDGDTEQPQPGRRPTPTAGDSGGARTAPAGTEDEQIAHHLAEAARLQKSKAARKSKARPGQQYGKDGQ